MGKGISYVAQIYSKANNKYMICNDKKTNHLNASCMKMQIICMDGQYFNIFLLVDLSS